MQPIALIICRNPDTVQERIKKITAEMRSLIALSSFKGREYTLQLDGIPSFRIGCKHPVSPFIFSSFSLGFYWAVHPPT
jgi:hypothetical protein